MQKLRKILAATLVLLLLVQSVPLVLAKETTESDANVLYVFDLETFINTLPTSKVRYDYVKLATALQGLANREQPQLYFYFLDGDEAKKVDWDIDEYWLSELQKDGEYLSDYTIQSVTDYWEMFSLFKNCYDGIVLWDENVPATANVASTIAGVENLLPVRYATDADALYTAMLSNGFTTSDVKKNLVNKFTGTGTIPESSTPSTGSAKDDAYIWAKENYLDTGKTNPLLMTYSIDGGSWVFEDDGTTERNAKFVSAALPDTMKPGEIVKIKITVKNTGTETWKAKSMYRLGFTTSCGFEFYTNETGTAWVTSNHDRLELSTDVAPDEQYTFEGYLKAPATEGSYEVGMKMVLDGVAQFGKTHTHGITVAEATDASTDHDAHLLMTYSIDGGSLVSEDDGTTERNAKFVSATLPDTMKPEEIVKISITVKNTGTETWKAKSYYRLGFTTSCGFGFYTNQAGTTWVTSSHDRLALSTDVAPDGQYTFEGYLKAPATEGSYEIGMQMVLDGQGWFGDTYTYKITVDTLVETPIGGSGITYENLFNTALANADYYIANKAFFWDLSPDASIVPIDDRTQPIGSDVATLKKILLSQAKQAEAAAEKGNGTGIYTVGGFVPWFLKYTSYADKKSSMEAVTAEYTMVEIISSYHGQTDADAFGTVGLSNASVFSKVPLSENLTQNNDKGENSTVVYDENTAYILFYMGDWDGAAWVNGILPFIWKESQEDAKDHPDDPIPLAWPINSCLADRIPQVYNMLYETAGTTDYFVTGDNGTGYLNPMFLEGEYVPEGLENYLNQWVAHNVAANKKFDLDITGFLIEGTLSSGSGSTETVRQAYSQMTPYGVVSSNAYGNIVNDGVTTPFPKMYSLANMRTADERQSAANTIAGNIKFEGQFFVYRSVKASRANIRDTLALLEEQNPGIKYEVVDPYTFMMLYAQYAESAAANTGAVYDVVQDASAITIDGVIGENEWTTADSMVVSKSSQEITDHGYIWGSFQDTADLEATYRMKWDDDYLYLLEERTDNYIKDCYTTGTTPLYDIDASMLFLDLDGLRDGTKYFEGDFAIHYSFDDDNAAVIYLRTGTASGVKNHTLLSSDAVSAARTRTETGYIVELAIPWSLFTNGTFCYVPATGDAVGMTVLAIDHDESTSGGRQIMWHGNGDTQENWGVLRLVSKATVTFMDGDTMLKTVDVWSGDTVENFTPTRDGYTFKGWYTSTDATEAYDFDTPVCADLTLYARWSKNTEGSFQFFRPVNAASTATFVDVPTSHWAFDAVEFMAENGWFNGVDASHFDPNGKLTRAMLVTVLWRMEGEPKVAYAATFEDVSDGQWYTTAVEWAAANGVVNGTGSGFDPNGYVTREQIAVILWRLAGKPAVSGDLSAYPDGAQVSAYATDAMIWAVQTGLFKGDGYGRLNPRATASRADAAVLLQHFSV